MSMQKVSINFEGKEYSLETGRFAKFANGAVMVRCGDTMVLVTATASSKELEGIDFLPLQCEYKEKTASAGKIPGGFMKREGRPSDTEILTARLMDRPIRPMISKAWHHETQVIATVYSYDPEVKPDTMAGVGASAALLISDIPFMEPVSQVRIAKIEGELIANPSDTQLELSTIDMSVSGTDAAITMVEGESSEISEEEFLEALDFAHDKIKALNKLQKDLQDLIKPVKKELVEKEYDEELVAFVEENASEKLREYIYSNSTKAERSETRMQIAADLKEAVAEKYADVEDIDIDAVSKDAGEILSKVEKRIMRNMILVDKKRLDGRKTTDIRPITCEIGLLPRAHGSALFTRGETQSLTTITLGTTRDEQMIDGLNPMYTERFMLHYNFPPFSVGETGRLFVGRREVGHGHLAWRALKSMLPCTDDFPYTLRVVSDILESNGSSSMATVCAGSLSMFDAGVPMKKPVAGIAMGLIKEEENVAVLSDILGDEDFLGDMDFKVTGTEEGITAFQMDIKIDGLSVEIMKEALEQARIGRLHILGIMNDAIDAPREDISMFAPRFTSITVPQDMIGAIIGPGGETIRSITKETETEINIEDDGTVLISAVNGENAEAAIAIIRSLTKKPEAGTVYTGKIVEIREGLGAFVEILPKVQGLLHISQIDHERVETVADYLKVGEEVEVKLMEITPDGKMRLSRKALLPMPPHVKEEMERRKAEGGGRERSDRRDGNGGGYNRDNRDRNRGDRDRGPRRNNNR